MAGSALAGGGEVYASDDDPALIRTALPFGIKTIEGLIERAPDNADLRLAAARSLAAYAFLAQEEDAVAVRTTAEQRTADRRAARLYRRARDHALAGLEVAHPGFADDLLRDRDAALGRTKPADAELLYWAGAAWSGAVSADKRDLGMVAELPVAGALAARVVELDDGFDGGAAHEILMLYEASRPGGSLDAAEAHYRRAVALSGGASAGAHVGFAESVAVARQDQAAFREALDAALGVDLDADPGRRLANVLAQRKAQRLIADADKLFLETEGGAS